MKLGAPEDQPASRLNQSQNPPAKVNQKDGARRYAAGKREPHEHLSTGMGLASGSVSRPRTFRLFLGGSKDGHGALGHPLWHSAVMEQPGLRVAWVFTWAVIYHLDNAVDITVLVVDAQKKDLTHTGSL